MKLPLGIWQITNYNRYSLNVPKDNTVLNVIQEEWKPIKGFEGLYEISNTGKFRNNRNELKLRKHNIGYSGLMLAKEGKKSYKLVHRVVAETFIPNPEQKREVNHIDGNKKNNLITNLEWVTSSENKQHALLIGITDYKHPPLGRKLSKCPSKYHNVAWDKDRKKWIGVVRHEKKDYFRKRFDTELEAAAHVNWILDKLQLYDRPRNKV